MVKCAPCRVRHLSCDQNIICTECSKANRECLRGYNLRFRYLTCPSTSPSRADFTKYDFFFSDDQTWVESCGNEGKVEFLRDEDEGRTARIDDGESADVDVATSTGASIDYKAIDSPSAQAFDNISQVEDFKSSVPTPLSKLDVLADQSLADAFTSGSDAYATTRHVELQSYPVSRKHCEWSVANLRECRLLQHFIEHMAPWVSTLPLNLAFASPLTLTRVRRWRSQEAFWSSHTLHGSIRFSVDGSSPGPLRSSS